MHVDHTSPKGGKTWKQNSTSETQNPRYAIFNIKY